MISSKNRMYTTTMSKSLGLKKPQSRTKALRSDQRSSSIRRLHRRPETLIADIITSRAEKKAVEAETAAITASKDLVNWYPWGPDTFDKAEEEDKLLFLAIGPPTSHWWQNTELEGFCNSIIAKLLNTYFIPIKIDSHVRPDIARLYGEYVRKATDQIDWPLIVFTTSTLGPVYGTSYLPVFSTDGELSLQEAIEDMVDGWQSSRTAVVNLGRGNVRDLTTELKPHLDEEDLKRADEEAFIVDDLMDGCTDALIDIFDEKYGGFGEKEKFIRASSLKLIQREFLRRGDQADYESLTYLLKMLLYTIGAMHDGGIHDHIGGGFFRSAMDRIWHVPQFEKSLVDNVQIAQIYLSIAQMLSQQKWYTTARSTLDYVVRELRAPEGGFYTAQGADSPDPETGGMREGAFYVWQAEEVQQVLNGKESEIFSDFYHVLQEGNCFLTNAAEEREYPTNCLTIQQRTDDMADKYEMTETEICNVLTVCKKKLFDARSKRPKPVIDKKIVAGYNGVAIAAFAEAARALKQEEVQSDRDSFPATTTDSMTYLTVAREVGQCVLDHLWDEKKQILMRYYENGKAGLVPGFAEDYALVAAGFLELYTSSGERSWLEWAIRLHDRMNALFWDEDSAGYFASGNDHISPPLEMKYSFDNADQPSAHSVAISNALRLSGVVDDHREYHRTAKKIIELCCEYFQDNLLYLPEFASSLFFAEEHPSALKIVIIGHLDSEATERYLDAMYSSYAPSKSLVAIDPSDKAGLEFWQKYAPELMKQVEDDVKQRAKTKESSEAQPPIVYVCEDWECFGPLKEASELFDLLQFAIEREPVYITETETIENINESLSKFTDETSVETKN